MIVSGGREGGSIELFIPPLQLSSMTKTPYPLVDYIMFLPWLALLNVYIGTPLPETLLLGIMVVSTGS